MTRPVWSVRYRSPTLPLGEFGTDGLSEMTSRELYEEFVRRVKESGGAVELLRDGERVAFFEKELS